MIIKPDELVRFNFSQSFGLAKKDGTPVVTVEGTAADFHIFIDGKTSTRIPSFSTYHRLQQVLKEDRLRFFFECVDLVNKHPSSGYV